MKPENLREYAMMHSSFLIEKAREGDDAAFSKLVGIWFKRIYNFALKYFGDHDTAMEVTQKTFIAVHRNIHNIKETGKFKSWLYKVAFNQFHEEERRNKRHSFLSVFSTQKETGYVSERGPESEFRNKELSEVLKDFLSMLPEDQRTVVIMKEYEGFKFREIAEALDISENTAKSRLYYGLKGLRKMMTEKNITTETI